MANFFDEERHYCDCGSVLFIEEQTFILIKDEDNKCSKTPCNKIIKCASCGKVQQEVKIKGE